MNDDNDFMINNFCISPAGGGALDAPSVNISLDPANYLPLLSWPAVEGANVYHIYHALSPDGEYTHLGDSTQTSFPIAETQSKQFFKITAE